MDRKKSVDVLKDFLSQEETKIDEEVAWLPKWEAGPALEEFCRRANEEWAARRQ